MNRLVLIGNGFDLAHGLKTSYKDFINWYWDSWGHRLLRGQGKELTDGLCSFTLKDEINMNSWSYVWGYHYTRNNPFKPWDLNVVVNTAKEDKNLCDFAMCDFLKQICTSIETKNWVDIENEYYSLLTLRNSHLRPSTEQDIKDLNIHLDTLKDYLINYLRAEEKKEVKLFDEIKDKIYRPI